jgi:hypothetical protein
LIRSSSLGPTRKTKPRSRRNSRTAYLSNSQSRPSRSSHLLWMRLNRILRLEGFPLRGQHHLASSLASPPHAVKLAPGASAPPENCSTHRFGHSLWWGNQCLCARPKLQLREAGLDSSSRRDFITATAGALIIGVLLSWGAVYGLNRYLGETPPETTGTVLARPPAD